MALLRAPDQFSPTRRAGASTPTCGGCCCCCCVGTVVGTSIALPIAIYKADERERREKGWIQERPTEPRHPRVRPAAIQAALAMPIGCVVFYATQIFTANAGLLGLGISLFLGYLAAFLIAAFAVRRARIVEAGTVATWLITHGAVWIIEFMAALYFFTSDNRPLGVAFYCGLVIAIAAIIPVVARWRHERLVHLRDPHEPSRTERPQRS